MPVFRPYPVLTLLMLPALAFLLWLGSWQLDRRAWKAELLAAFDATLAAPAISLSDGVCGEGDAAPGLRVRPETLAPEGNAIRIYGRNGEGAPGWRVFQPATPAGCPEHRVLVETGFERLESAGRADDSPVRPASVTLTPRFESPPAPGPFTPASDPEAGRFYAYDPLGMAAALDLAPDSLETQWWVPLSDGAPPAYLTQTPPERHLAYAITWFAMVLALLGVYLAFHIRAGRLRLR